MCILRLSIWDRTWEHRVTYCSLVVEEGCVCVGQGEYMFVGYISGCCLPDVRVCMFCE